MDLFVLSVWLTVHYVNDATSNLQLLLWGFPCLESSQINYAVGEHQTPDHSM